MFYLVGLVCNGGRGFARLTVLIYVGTSKRPGAVFALKARVRA
jgi:hypothetical protein